MRARSPIEMMVDKACGFDPSVAPARKLLDAEAAAFLAVADAAKAWWEGKRPLAFTEDDHLDEPTVNCTGARDNALCLAVAEMVRLGG